MPACKIIDLAAVMVAVAGIRLLSCEGDRGEPGEDSRNCDFEEEMVRTTEFPTTTLSILIRFLPIREEATSTEHWDGIAGIQEMLHKGWV